MSERLSGLALALEGGWGGGSVTGMEEGGWGGGASSDAVASMDQYLVHLSLGLLLSKLITFIHTARPPHYLLVSQRVVARTPCHILCRTRRERK